MNDRGRTWKALTLPYDAIMAKSDETSCYQLSSRTVAMLLSQTQYFYWHTRWSKDSPLTDIEREAIFNAAALVEYQLMTSDACEGCSDYAPNSNIISYYPNDPFTTPELIPPGYVLPPWYNNPLIALPGVLPGDAMVNGASIPVFASLPDILASGFPRARVTKTGPGQVEIQFVRVPQGGIALISIDDDPTSLEVINLDSINIGNFIALGELLEIILEPSLVEDFTHEINFSTEGPHWVDITFLPNVGEDIVLGFGGGIRRITLCGEPAMSDDCCKLYKLVDGVLYESEDGGITFERVPDGGNGPWDEFDPTVDGHIFRPPGPSDSACQSAWNAARVYQAFHVELAPHFVVGGLIALAMTSIGTTFSFFLGGGPLAIATVGTIVASAIALVAGGLVADDFDEEIVEELVCIFEAHFTPQGDFVQGEFESLLADLAEKDGLIWQAIFLYVSGMGWVGLNNAGFTQSVEDPDCDACHNIEHIEMGSQIEVPVYSTMVSEVGKTYLIRSEGGVNFGGPLYHPIYWYWPPITGGAWVPTYAFPTAYSTHYGLNINGARPEMQDLREDAIYEWEYAGTGDPFMFFIADDVGGYYNNSGAFFITITELP